MRSARSVRMYDGADCVIDGGRCEYGVASTVVDLVEMRILKGAGYERVVRCAIAAVRSNTARVHLIIVSCALRILHNKVPPPRKKPLMRSGSGTSTNMAVMMRSNRC